MTSVEFFGESFALNDTVSEFALMEFAEAAADGLDADAMAGMAAMMRLIKECIVKADVARFLKSARANRASSNDLLPVLKAMFEQPAGPRARPSRGEEPEARDGDAGLADRLPPRSDRVLQVERRLEAVAR